MFKGSGIATPEAGLPRYSFDPQSQQYTQLPPQGLPTTQSDGGFGLLGRLLQQLNVQQSPGDTVYRYSYDPGSQQYTRLKDGGIARAQAAGRHGDDRLVHMSSAELEALRALAKRHGKELTINPETGLPEAFKLKEILPTVAAGALMFFGGPVGMAIGEGLGLEGALAQGVGMGLLSGGVTTALTGDVKKGLTSGLMSGLSAGLMYNPASASTGAVPTSNVQTEIPAAQVSPVLPDASTVTPIQAPPVVTPGASPIPMQTIGADWEQMPELRKAFTEVSGGMFPTEDMAAKVAATLPPPSVAPAAPTATPEFAAAPTPTPSPVSVGQQYIGADFEQMPEYSAMQQIQSGTPAKGLGSKFMDWWDARSPKEKMLYGGSAIAAASLLAPKPKLNAPPIDKGNIRPYTYTRTQYPGAYPVGPTYGSSGLPVLDSRERNYFNNYYTALPTYKAAVGGEVPPTGPVERMSQNIVGAGGMYPQSQMDKTYFATPTQMPASAEVIAADYDARTNPFTGEPVLRMSGGGLPPLGGYSDGGRLLKGPGDGVSDDIPATIAGKQPARLADGEFVIPSRIVSELGNGSTDAGAKRLYAMMDRVQKARQKSAKKGKFAIDSKAEKYLPA